LMVALLTPCALPMVLQLQCVAALGRVWSVASTIRLMSSEVKRALRPRPSATSQRQSGPCARKRFRHKAAVLKLICNCAAMTLSDWPWAAAKIILQRCETCRGVRWAATQRCNSRRSGSVKFTGAAWRGIKENIMRRT